MGPTRQDTFRVTVSAVAPVTGAHRDLGVWDKKSGGEGDTEQYKYKPGNMGKHISLGGTVTVGDITISRLYIHERDHVLMPDLNAWLGKARFTIKQQPLDVDGNPFGNSPLTWTGILKTVTPPEHDSESTDPAMLELVISSDGDTVSA